MSYSYSAPIGYPQNVQLAYDMPQQSETQDYSLLLSGTGAVVGGGVGAYLGYKKNPYMSGNSTAKDSFTRIAYDKYADKVGDIEQKINTQSKDILKKIDKTKTPDELKNLLNTNSDSAKQALGTSYDDIINNLNENNLSQNKTTIKKSVEAQRATNMQKMKNWIESCWDTKAKKFVKPDSMNENVFNSIKEATSGLKTKAVLKYSAIGAAATGVVAFVASKILNAQKTEPTQETVMVQPEATNI